MDTEERKFIQHSKIYGYWKHKSIKPNGDICDISESGENDIDVVADWGEPSCWACGRTWDNIYAMSSYEKWLRDDIGKIYDCSKTREHLQRCHIVPHALGGSDTEPENYFLLCKSCHDKSPDTAEPRLFLRWVYKMRRKQFVDGRDIGKMISEIIDECAELGLDPASGDFGKLPEMVAANNRVAESSVVLGYVSTCSST